MRFKINIWAALALVLLAVLLTFQITYISVDNKYNKKLAELVAESPVSSSYAKLNTVDELYRSMYIGEIDDEKLVDGIIAGYIYGTGDKYAHYYDAESFSALMNDYAGEMQGIGVNVIYNADYAAIEVINVMPDSPALEAGVMPGDLIFNVAGEDVSQLGYYPAVAKMQGEAGTTAEFTVARGDNYSERVDFSIVRGHITEQTVMSHVYALDPTVGVIRITSFDSKTPEQFFAACGELLDGGCEKLVIDIRYNPGGELNSISAVLDYLLPAGPVVRMVDREGKETVIDSDSSELDVPMAVVVNGSTASAGELFASALQDYDKAELVGTVTYGKGTVQKIMQLPDGSGLTISYQMYYPPFSDNYEGVGVIPDIEVELDEALEDKNIYKITDEEDNQLAAAVATFG